jgi:hypothetical protein
MQLKKSFQSTLVESTGVERIAQRAKCTYFLIVLDITVMKPQMVRAKVETL